MNARRRTRHLPWIGYRGGGLGPPAQRPPSTLVAPSPEERMAWYRGAGAATPFPWNRSCMRREHCRAAAVGRGPRRWRASGLSSERLFLGHADLLW